MFANRSFRVTHVLPSHCEYVSFVSTNALLCQPYFGSIILKTDDLFFGAVSFKVLRMYPSPFKDVLQIPVPFNCESAFAACCLVLDRCTTSNSTTNSRNCPWTRFQSCPSCSNPKVTLRNLYGRWIRILTYAVLTKGRPLRKEGAKIALCGMVVRPVQGSVWIRTGFPGLAGWSWRQDTNDWLTKCVWAQRI